MSEPRQQLDVPYRLETVEHVRRAIDLDILGLGHNLREALEKASSINISAPAAFKKAKKAVQKDFYMLKEKRTLELAFEKIEIADLEAVDNFASIEESIPWTTKVAAYDNIFEAFAHITNSADHYVKTLPFSAKGLEMLLSIRELMRREIVANASAERGKHIDRNTLKEIIVAGALFDSKNHDILTALRMPGTSGSDNILYQNACAELLFSRLPEFISETVLIDPKYVRQKLFAKTANLGLTAQQKMALFGYFKPNIGSRELMPVLDKLDSISAKILDEDKARRLHHYISSIKRKVGYTGTVYKELFLSAQYEAVRKLYRPHNVLRSTVSYRERIIKTHVKVATLAFYPTKDYFDLLKGEISEDCTVVSLSDKQLNTTNFFNIRIFRKSLWIGNIYMLDFTKERGVLLLDRIQIPRGIDAEYMNFFPHLKEALQEVFSDVEYRKVLLPLAISNHESIQKAFNIYKDNLPKEYVKLPQEYAARFESLRQNSGYYALLSGS